MKSFESYEKYCKAFSGNADEIEAAELLLFIQDWIVRMSDRVDAEDNAYSLDILVRENKDKTYLRNEKKDAISRIVDDSFDAIRRISDNMRENIIRENVKLPVYKVREVNSYGLNWLSRRPGATIKEKISSSNSSMMAVQRRMSLDTGENRLYLAFLKELSEYLETKLERCPKEKIGNALFNAEDEICSQLFSFIRTPELDEIRRWENMPPNNTLLSDQYYKKIWRCWNELKLIDSFIQDDCENIANRICLIFCVEFITKASDYIWFPQIPIEVDYANYEVRFVIDHLFGVDIEGNVLALTRKNKSIVMKYKSKEITVRFVDNTIIITDGGKDDWQNEVKNGLINKYVELVLKKLSIKNFITSKVEPKTKVKCNRVLLDLFLQRPLFIADDDKIAYLQGRIINQSYCREDNDLRTEYDLACDISHVILMGADIDTYTVASAIENSSSSEMRKLVRSLEQYIEANKVTFLFPDIYNEFQLGQVHKAARLAYQDVRAFPRSVATAFDFMSKSMFNQEFVANDFLLVIDLIGTDVSFTLIQGLEDDNVKGKIPEYNGIIWERHPSISYSFLQEIKDGLFDPLITSGCAEPEKLYDLFGLEGLINEAGNLAIAFENENIYLVSENTKAIVNNFKINLTDKVNEFLFEHKGIVGSNRVHIISLVPQLFYKGNSSFWYCSREETLEGCRLFGRLQKMTKTILWRDHLPELSIKMLYGKFNLVDNETITPEFNVEKKIKISNTFTLLKHMREYHFELVQNDVNRKTRYAAVVKNPAFPLNHDVLCRLDLTYQYGADEPYRLLFIPIESNAGFVEAKVSWEKIEEYPYKDLPCPSTLQRVPWNELYQFNGKNGVLNLVESLSGVFSKIARGYQCYQFDDGYCPTTYGKLGNRIFTERFGDSAGDYCVIFEERSIEKTSPNDKSVNFSNLGLISCELDFSSSKRYTFDLSVGAGFNNIWIENQYGYSCYRTMTVDGSVCTVAFFSKNFMNPAEFSTEINRVSFELERYSGNKYTAINILDEDIEPVAYYKAKNIRTGNRPCKAIYGGFNYFLLHTITAGRSSLFEDGAPVELQDTLSAAVNNWITMFYNTDSEFVKSHLFGQMSLVAKDIGYQYYDMALASIDDYLEGKVMYVNSNVGYALGALESEAEHILLDKIMNLKNEEIVPILSKAIWKNDRFILNMSIPTLLKYFDYTIDYLKRIYKKEKKNRDVLSCLELLLGLFRLREYQDEGLSKRLSLNNPKVQELYRIVEDLIKYNLDLAEECRIKSNLKLELTDGSELDDLYKDIPIILYAMLLFITGEKGAGEIKISGLNLDDIEKTD